MPSRKMPMMPFSKDHLWSWKAGPSQEKWWTRWLFCCCKLDCVVMKRRSRPRKMWWTRLLFCCCKVLKRRSRPRKRMNQVVVLLLQTCMHGPEKAVAAKKNNEPGCCFCCCKLDCVVLKRWSHGPEKPIVAKKTNKPDCFFLLLKPWGGVKKANSGLEQFLESGPRGPTRLLLKPWAGFKKPILA